MVGSVSPSLLNVKFKMIPDRGMWILKWLLRLAAIYLFLEWGIWYLVFSAMLDPEPLRLFEYVKGFGAGLVINVWLWISTVRLRLMWKWIVLIPVLLMLTWYGFLIGDRPTFGQVLGLVAYVLAIFMLFKPNPLEENHERCLCTQK
jgi:hypothetical protein